MRILERIPAVSAPYRWIAGLHGTAYRAGLLPRVSLDRFAVSVGALHFGGAGKTPLVATLARAGDAVLSRGYGGRRRPEALVAEGADATGPIWSRMVTCGGQTRPAGDWSGVLGDEPAMLAATAPGVPVAVCADRCAAALRVTAQREVRRFLLDDAFSHHRLRRDVDVVVLPLARQGRWWLAPGPLREGTGALARATAVVFAFDEPPEQPEARCRELAEWLNLQVPVAGFHRSVMSVTSFPDGADVVPGSLHGTDAVLHSGLGRPASLRATVQGELGARIVGERVFPDHHRYGSDELRATERLAVSQRADTVLTTVKDAMRLPLGWLPGVPWHVVDIGVQWDSGQDAVLREVEPL